jgi:Predicted hydrolases or acyltransferases (alpha/beta hydrolase superfamily)
MKKERFVQLQGDAVVAFQEYGDANGVPVIFCHGWPSSCTMARLTDEPARELGVRIISPDRPGISGSSLQPNRKLADWPRVIERVLDHVGIGEFRALAISGGAPYAYAMAATMPERVRAIAIVGGAVPMAGLETREDCCHFTAGCWRSIDRDRNFCEGCFVWRVRFWLCVRLSAFGRYF